VYDGRAYWINYLENEHLLMKSAAMSVWDTLPIPFKKGVLLENLKGLSREIDFKTFDKDLQN
jgi:hypothetical protein